MQNDSQDNDVLRKIECNCSHLEFLICNYISNFLKSDEENA